MKLFRFSLKTLFLILLIFNSRMVFACSLPLSSTDINNIKQDVPYLSYGNNGNFTERAVEAEFYCWGPNIYTAASVTQLTTPADKRNYAVYWYIGWTGASKLSLFIDYGIDLIELGISTVSGDLFKSSSNSLDQRFTSGLVYRYGKQTIVRIYYRNYRLSGPLVTDGQYAYYGVSLSTKLF